MLNNEKLDKLLAILGDLTGEQKAFLTEALNGPINEKELFEKLGVDDGKYTEFMQALAAEQEDAVMGQELSPDELDAVGAGGPPTRAPISTGDLSNLSTICLNSTTRYIYEGGFPNCAATVEDGSWCDTNDACRSCAVVYLGMKSCGKAWR